jgi:hypothetical protein
VSVDELLREVLIAQAPRGHGSTPPRKSRLWELRKDLALGVSLFVLDAS